MIKPFLALILIFSFSFTAFASASLTPDILVYTKVEKDWNLFLLKEFRSFMNNLNLEIDPYSYSVSTPLIYSEENIQKYVTESADELLHKVGKAIGLNYTSIKPELIINQFAYKFSKIEPIIKPVEEKDGNVTLKSDLKITGVEVFANDISLEFTIPGLSKKPTVRIVNPRVIVKDDFKLDFSLDVKLVEKKKDINLRLLNGNFSKITQALTENPD